MEATFNLMIVSARQILFEGPAVSLIVPGAQGELEVLAQHAPLVAALKAGSLRVRAVGKDVQTFPVPGDGVVEVLRNEVTVFLNDAR